MMRRTILSITLVCLGIVACGFLEAYSLAGPRHSRVGSLPADLRGRDIELVGQPTGQNGLTLHGWFVPAPQRRGTIVLLHGIRGNRLQMLDRVRFLNRAGYSALLYDSRAHGESGGDAVTFGRLESEDCRTAVKLARTLGGSDRVGVIGFSLGGAAALLAEPPLDVDAIVAESVYPSVDRAIANRLQLRMGPAGPMFAPFLLSMFPIRLGFSASQLRPIDHVRSLPTPKLFIFGSEDRDTTLQESLEMFEAAAQPKQMWAIQGAGHVDSYTFAGADYERRVLEFLNKYVAAGSLIR